MSSKRESDVYYRVLVAPSGESYGDNAGLAESNGILPLDGWLKVTCLLNVCIFRSAPGPTLGDEYGRTLPVYLLTYLLTYIS